LSNVPRRFPHDWALLTSFRRNPTALVRTTRGTFRFELYYQEAPFTVESFISLARKHFYDGLLFHRVVPNFVVQGGDPRGDGTGGPPYTIRSEFGERSFRRGDVGIASSGKDTEGSQFFIMHSPAPHLDGRYTLFGTVIEGMDVVDRLEIGDRMLDIQIDPSR
jgi:cyclophilin family peptidyl-prolyl cis-trans isomerase